MRWQPAQAGLARRATAGRPYPRARLQPPARATARARRRGGGAQSNYEGYLAIMCEVGDARGEGVALFKLALIYEQHGDLNQAEAYHRRSLQLSVDVNATQDIADSYAYLGEFLITKRDQRDEGCGMLSEAARLYEQMGVPGAEEARETARRVGCDG